MLTHPTSFINDFLAGVRLTFTGGNEVAQTAQGKAPAFLTNIVALIGRHQPDVGEADFRLVSRPGNFKDNIRTDPLALILNKVKVVFYHVPDDFLTGHQFGDFERAT